MLTPDRQEKLAAHAYRGQWASIIAAVGAIIATLATCYTVKVNADRDVAIARLGQGQATISRQVTAAADSAEDAAKAAARASVHAQRAEAEAAK